MEQKFIFIGENRSPTAQDKGWSWQSCQLEGRPHLCAVQLFGALENCGLNPYGKQVIFLNLWHDDARLNEPLVTMVGGLDRRCQIIGLGQKVCLKLSQKGIPHTALVHPAARGRWRRAEVYNQHVKDRLFS